MKTTFALHALPFVLRSEGGYSNNPNDPGGATNKGITQAEYNIHRRECKLPQRNVMYITLEEATNIYQNNYWAPIQGDDLPYPIDWIVFDCAVNCGVQTAVNMLEQAEGLPDHLAIGPAVVAAAKTACSSMTGAHALKTTLLNKRLAYYRKIAQLHPALQEFLPGWVNRVEALRVAS